MKTRHEEVCKSISNFERFHPLKKRKEKEEERKKKKKEEASARTVATNRKIFRLLMQHHA